MPDALSNLVTAVMTNAATTHHAIHEIQRRWKRIVGASLAASSRPVSLRRGVLSVEVDDPGTAYALSLKKSRALAQLSHATAPVTELVVRAGGRGARRAP